MVAFSRGGAGAGVANALFSRHLKTKVISGAAADTDMALAGIDPRVDELVSVMEVRSGLKVTLVAGGALGAHTVTGIATTDRLVSVLHVETAAAIATAADVTAQFSISAANTIDNTGGAMGTSINDQLWVFWEDNSTSAVDRTSATTISSYGNLRCTAATTGSNLLVTYSDRQIAG